MYDANLHLSYGRRRYEMLSIDSASSWWRIVPQSSIFSSYCTSACVRRPYIFSLRVFFSHARREPFTGRNYKWLHGPGDGTSPLSLFLLVRFISYKRKALQLETNTRGTWGDAQEYGK